MTREKDSAAAVARLLDQRKDLGGQDLFLDGMTRDDALRLVAEARRRALEGPSPAPGPQASQAPDRPEGSPTRAHRQGMPTSGAEAALPILPDSYEELRGLALGCTACGLHETRRQVVFSDGNPQADLVVVGEAPGAKEDETGRPFVGAAGQFLDLLLATVDLSRAESVYICNVLKCRPPGNRNPQPDEIERCSPFLLKQIELVAPKALLAVGTFSAQLLTGQHKALGKLRGDVHAYHGVPLVVTYHPAALLRNPRWTRAFWDDLQLLRQVMDGS
jgi:DNA polymerase